MAWRCVTGGSILSKAITATPETHHPHNIADILQMLGHCDDFAPQFHQIDFKALRDFIIKPEITSEYDEEVLIRGFFRVFKNTDSYKQAFRRLDPAIQPQVLAFTSGSSARQALLAVPKTGLLGNFSPIQFVKDWFTGCVRRVKRQSKGVSRSLSRSMTSAKTVDDISDAFDDEKSIFDMPIVWEDAAYTQKVEVSLLHSPQYAIADYSRSTLMHPFQTGAKQSKTYLNTPSFQPQS